MNSRAAILTAFNKPIELVDFQWNEWRPFSRPSDGRVAVRMISAGICGAQLSEIRGEKNPDAPVPRMMGHEGVGIVEDVAPNVRRVKRGDKVVCHWRKGDGIDAECARWAFGEIKVPTSTLFHTAGQITTFSTHSVISENRLTPVPEDTPDELCCLLGCSLSTALGVIENEAAVKIGESVLIIGCGGLGLNLILAAKMRGASDIWSVDARVEKVRPAMQVGATGFWAPTDEYKIEKEFDVVIDTTGSPERISHGIELLKPSGRMIMVGQPVSDVMIPNARRMFEGSGKTITATQGGRFNPTTDIPHYVDAWRAGRLNLDGVISHRLPLSRINEGLDLVRAGQAGRVLITCATE